MLSRFFLFILGLETVDHFPIVTAILGIFIELVCKPSDTTVKDKSAAALINEPGFQFALLDSVVNSPQGVADKKQFALKNCKFYFA